MKPLALGLLILLSLTACEREPLVASRVVVPDPFSRIKLSSALDVFLTEGPDYSVTIEGAEELVDHVQVSVEAGVLSIENSKALGWLAPKAAVRIYISSPPLRELTVAEGCDIRTVTPITSPYFGLILEGKSNQATLELDGHTFYYWNHFPMGGRLTLSGRTEVLQIWNVALTSVDARDLYAGRALVENSSKGDCTVTVRDTLEYRAGGPGKIHLYGSPQAVLPLDPASSDHLVRH